MLLQRKDGTLVYYPVERAVTRNPEVIVRECTLENGVKIIMHCHYGEKTLEIDPVAYAAAREAEGLDHASPVVTHDR